MNQIKRYILGFKACSKSSASNKAKNLLIFFLSTYLLSCYQSDFNNTTKKNKAKRTGYIKDIICRPGMNLGNVDCSKEIKNAFIAQKTRTCNSSGKGYDYGQCNVVKCASGYHAIENNCIVPTCPPNKNLESIDCKDEIKHATKAEKSKTCSSSGDSFTYGSCNLLSCEEGYEISENSCIPERCTPNEVLGSIDCKDEIPNSSVAEKSKLCNSAGDGYEYGKCNLLSCENEYLKANNTCVSQACTPNEKLGQIDCSSEIPNSSKAEKSMACNSQGIGYDYGKCNLSSCESGYYKSKNKCKPHKCTPGTSYDDVSCSISNASSASKTKSCKADGSGYEYGKCIVDECKYGYYKSSSSKCSKNPVFLSVKTKRDGSCTDMFEVSDGAVRYFTIKNYGSSYTYPWYISESYWFNAYPSWGYLAPGESVRVKVRFYIDYPNFSPSCWYTGKYLKIYSYSGRLEDLIYVSIFPGMPDYGCRTGVSGASCD